MVGRILLRDELLSSDLIAHVMSSHYKSISEIEPVFLSSPSHKRLEPHMPTTVAQPTNVIFNDVVIVIPALNEEHGLTKVLAELPVGAKTIVVDNGSDDSTAEVARQAGADVIVEPRRGYGSACQAGIAAARHHGAHIIVILDADYSDDPTDLIELVTPIHNEEADMVLGERVTHGQPGSMPTHQRLGNRLATALIFLMTGHRYTDMGPFRAIRATALAKLDMKDLNYGWNVEMQMKAIRCGLRVKEVPVHYRPRVGKSKISGTITGSIKGGTKILYSTMRYAR